MCIRDSGNEQQVVWREKMVQAPGSCAPSWQFYRDVGRKLDPGRYPDFKDPEDLYRRFSALVPSWKGMTLERLRESPDGLVWPLYSLEDKERTGSVFAEGKLLTPSGKMKAVDTLFGRFPQWDYPKGSPLGKDRSDDFPLVLTQEMCIRDRSSAALMPRMKAVPRGSTAVPSMLTKPTPPLARSA